MNVNDHGKIDSSIIDQDVQNKSNLNGEENYQVNIVDSNSSIVNSDTNESVFKTSAENFVLPPCQNCRLKCSGNISPECRQKQNNIFWKLNWLERRLFITNHVRKEEIKRKKVSQVKSQRINQYNYFIINDDDHEKQVCKTFFLTTLGFKPSNDSIIRNTMKDIDPVTLLPKPDTRGKTKIDLEIGNQNLKIEEHIMSFNPSVSHYRRAHAPNRKYLSNTLTITSLYKDFKEKTLMKPAVTKNMVLFSEK